MSVYVPKTREISYFTAAWISFLRNEALLFANWRANKANHLNPVLSICLRSHLFLLFAACSTFCLQRVNLCWQFAFVSDSFAVMPFYFVVSF